MDHSRIIRGAVGGGRYTVTAPITQWDYGYLFLPEIDDLPATYRLDFSNDEHHGTAYAVYGGEDGAEVPEELIDTGKDIFVWYFYIGDGYGKSEYKWRIPNKCKPKTSEDEPTPSQQSSNDQLIARSNEAVTSAEQSATDAEQSAQDSASSAQDSASSALSASDSAERASASATSASNSASSASASATASANSASQAEQIKSDVEGMVDDAQGYAQSASQSATASANSASQASESATSASQSATSASGYATSAQSSAQTATAKASEASTSAQTASTKASEASASALSASGYATQAESAKTSAQTAQGLAESARDTAQGYAEDAQEYAEDAQASAESISASASQIATNTADIASLEADRYKPYPTDTASGSIASFSDGADDIPLKSLVVNIDPVQDLSQGDPSPTNICPISGWTGCNVRRCNENLWDDAWYALGDVMSLITDPTDDFYGYYGGSIASWAGVQRNNGLKTIFSDGVDQLTVTADLGNGGTGSFIFRIYFYYSDGTDDYYGGNINVGSGEKVRRSRTSNPNKKCTGFTVSTSAGTGNRAGRIKNVMVTVNDATDYIAPVANPLIPISWQSEAGTVYGGTLDVLSGVLRITHRLDEYVGSSSEAWSVITSPTETTDRTYLPMNGTKALSTVISSWLKTVSVASASNSIPWSAYINSSNRLLIHFPTGEFLTVDAWKTYLASHHLQVLCELAEPITYQLTPHEVNSLLGTNNIFADTGDASVEYRADTKLYINRLTEPDSDMIADANIVSGQYFMVGNNLYLATANIASGASVIVGTNATRKSLSEALNEINA